MLFFRSCTDIPCCILFVAYIVGMIVVGVIGKSHCRVIFESKDNFLLISVLQTECRN